MIVNCEIICKDKEVKEVEYPKPFMRKKDLIDMGIPPQYLDRAICIPGQTFAFKLDPSKKTSPYIFDTQGFEKWRVKDTVEQHKIMQRRSTIA